MDWNNTNQLLQALIVLALCFAFFMGYRAGDKL